jgi:RNA polymerase sigma-70 factor (ECF subfamily)
MNDSRKQLFDSLHQQYQAMVLQMCLGFMQGDRDLASDLSQDVFINIWNGIHSYRGDASHKTWIYRITVNTCLQYIRKEKNKKRVPVADIDNQPENPDIQMAEAEYNNLYRAIGQLNEVDRLIIMMVLDELEYEEITKVVGINQVNLRVKIHRIKQKLKKILENEYGT